MSKHLRYDETRFQETARAGSTVTLNDPEKGSNPRIWKVDQKVLAMLNNLPRESLKVFGESSLDLMKATFVRARRRLSMKLQNPRLQKISFHTF